MVSPDALSESRRTACDANRDGVIDEADVALLKQAGLLIANIDKTASQEEVETDGVYLEYCSLIDQGVEIAESAADEMQPAAEQESFVARVFRFVRAIYTYLFNLIFVKII